MAWDFMLQIYGRMAKTKTPFNILTGEIILGLYDYIKEINYKCRKCSSKKCKSLCLSSEFWMNQHSHKLSLAVSITMQFQLRHFDKSHLR